MLHPERAVRDDAVERSRIEHSGDTFMVARRSQPPASRRLQTGRKGIRSFYLGRAAVNRTERSCQRRHMNVMIVQARQQQAAASVKAPFACLRVQLTDGSDNAVVDAQVGDRAAFELRAANQHLATPARIDCVCSPKAGNRPMPRRATAGNCLPTFAAQ